MSITGSAANILDRIKRVLPNRWFSWVAPNRDALIGGLSDSGSWGYGLIGYVKSQLRLATAYGIWLDVIAYEFLGRFLTRSGMPDDTFRVVIKATILQERVTRAGMIKVLTLLTGNVPWIFEPWNTNDTGAYSNGLAKYGSMGYGVGQGGYGSMILPAQTFIAINRSSPSGVPNVGGYGSKVEGYGAGSGEYLNNQTILSGVTNTILYRLISMTKPTGSICWTAIGAPARGTPRRPAVFNAKNDSQNLAVI